MRVTVMTMRNSLERCVAERERKLRETGDLLARLERESGASWDHAWDKSLEEGQRSTRSSFDNFEAQKESLFADLDDLYQRVSTAQDEVTAVAAGLNSQIKNETAEIKNKAKAFAPGSMAGVATSVTIDTENLSLPFVRSR